MRSWTVTATAAALVVAMTVPAYGETADQARAQAQEAQAQVDRLQPEIQGALAAYDLALADLAVGTTRAVSASQAADEAAKAAHALRREQATRVRALYASGGELALYASVLDAGSPTDALSRIDSVQRVVDGGSERVAEARLAHETAVAQAKAAQAVADGVVATAGDVQQSYVAVLDVLAEAEESLKELTERARQLEEAEAAARAIEEARRQAASSAAARAARVKAGAVPVDYFALYRAAAATCPGLSWTVVAAIGQVETGHGRNTNDSYAGAQGPMQFMPRTFAAYGVDGDGDGRADIRNPADAIFSAANYLCANGAGNPRKLRFAIYRYNHAEWYVDMVLRIAGQLASSAGSSG